MSAPRTARDRIRDEVTREILTVARDHLAHEGAAALSLRSVARELEMAPSALYRYFPSRDALLSALILGAYESLADHAEAAAPGAPGAGADGAARWGAVPRAMRAWALGHPHEWALIFGSPVPGYEAPESTTVPYTRLARCLVRPLVEAQADGGPAPVAHAGADAAPALAGAVRPVAELLLPGLPTATVTRALAAFATLIGMISLELFGHWRNTVLDPEVFFEATVAELGSSLGL
ncbi:MAG: TetR/AcrR family transcriptional regulator [Acidimicrobiales bacterium]